MNHIPFIVFNLLSMCLRTDGIYDNTNVGCYRDFDADRDVGDAGVTPFTKPGHGLTIESGVALCRGRQQTFAAFQYSAELICGNTYGRHGRISEENCNRACDGNSSQICGGRYANSIYSVCPFGRYGVTCQYECHCAWFQCNLLTGVCLNNTECATGWTGPQCKDTVSSPKCRSSHPSVVENDTVSFSCSVEYRGHPVPDLVFVDQLYGRQYMERSWKTVTVNQNVTYHLELTAARQHDGMTISCRTFFTDVNMSSAINDPEYRDTTNCSTLSVQYAPRSVQVQPERAVYLDGSTVTCHADGNPAPTYQWTSSDQTVLSTNAMLSLQLGITTGCEVVQCVAANYVPDTTKSSTVNIIVIPGSDVASLREKCNSLESENDLTKIAAIALGTTSIVLLILTLALLILLSAEKKNEKGLNS